MATTTTSPSVKKYVDYAQQQVDEQAILDKYNAATIAQYNLQREQNRAAENQFYNQMYNTQKTAMDTIRQSNAAAVASGASRGVQAANELSAILGLQQESVQGATEIAQANRQTAQEETAAVLENVLSAYQQSVQERQQLVQQGIEAASVDAQESANQIAAQEAATNRMNAETNRQQAETQANEQRTSEMQTLIAAAENGMDAYLAALSNLGYDYATEPSTEGYNSLHTAISSIQTSFSKGDWDWDANGKTKAAEIERQVRQICTAYGIKYDDVLGEINSLKDTASKGAAWGNKTDRADASNRKTQAIYAKLQALYMQKLSESLAKD